MTTATTTLLLDSLEIENFRVFRHLQIERLGRVNLIVGKNNVGKTTLLEALWFYANQGSDTARRNILEARDEDIKLENLYYNRKLTTNLRIGPYNNKSNAVMFEKSMKTRQSPGCHCFFIKASGFDTTQMTDLWNKIAMSVHEEDIATALRIIDPRIERVGMVIVPTLGKSMPWRIPMARLHGHDYPISLRSLGDGMNRLFGIALALVNTRDSILLIDEVENGLHYSVESDVWRLIFEMAHRLNVQVFATTHSWECIEAFQQAAHDHAQEEGMLISLRRKDEEPEEIVAVLFDERRLSIATREQIEVR